MRVLLCEDDDRLARGLIRALERAGHRVVRAANVADAHMLASESVPDVALVDMTLPDGNGIDIVRRLRDHPGTAIIIITAHGAELDRVKGLRSGADDYVVKPFGVAEILARIDAIARRVRILREPTVTPALHHGTLTFDPQSRIVTGPDNSQIHLTAKEASLLTLLIQHVGSALEREYLLDQVWGQTAAPSRSLDTHIGVLRSKLGDLATIQTVRGVGYRLDQAQ